MQRLLTSALAGNTVEGEDGERKRLAAELTTILFPVLLEIYSASAGPGVRHAALQAMLRMVVSSEAELLSEVLQPAFLASQVAAMLSSQDLKIIVAALQLSETLLAKLPDLFSVHFRREGVLHQVQKLTDPDYTFSGNDLSSHDNLNMSWSTSSGSAQHPGRSWSIAGSSFANMFPEHLRQRGAREAAAASPEVTPGSSREAPETSQHSPMRLSDMLKRKRGASGRKSSRKTSTNTDTTDGTAGSQSGTSTPSSGAPPTAASAPSSAKTPTSTSPSGSKSGPATPGRRSRLSSASSLLSSLHPSRWVRTAPAPGVEPAPPQTVVTPTHQQTREKAKVCLFFIKKNAILFCILTTIGMGERPGCEVPRAVLQRESWESSPCPHYS